MILKVVSYDNRVIVTFQDIAIANSDYLSSEMILHIQFYEQLFYS